MNTQVRLVGCWIAASLVLCTLNACGNKPATSTADRDVNLTEGRELFKGRPKLGAAGSDRPVAPNDAAWTIVLAAFRGEDSRASADAALPAITSIRELEGAFVTMRGSAGSGQAAFIGIGRFADPSDPAAQMQLKRVREMTVGPAGERAFADAFLAPPETGSLEGSRPEFNLASVREKTQRGREALVTLQVGVYERIDGRATPEDLAEIRAAAEEAAVKLRRDGEQAYYFHGPRRSMVTIGIFSEDDVVKRRSPAAAALRKRNPYNLLNGQGYKASEQGPIRSSEFVRVP